MADPAGGHPCGICVMPSHWQLTTEAQQVTDRLGWKFLFVRPQMPHTRGALCMRVEQGRWQVPGPAAMSRCCFEHKRSSSCEPTCWKRLSLCSSTLLCINLAVVHALTHTSLPPSLLCVSREVRCCSQLPHAALVPACADRQHWLRQGQHA